MKANAKKCGKKHRKRKGNKSKQRGPRYWVAMGAMSALLAYTPIGCKKAEAGASSLGSGSAWEMAYLQNPVQGRKVTRFDIPPGPLETVLTTFQNLTGLQVFIPDDKMRTVSSPGVAGASTVQQALQQILAGT